MDRGIHMSKFPQQLTCFESENDFFLEYMDTITLQVVLYNDKSLPDLLAMRETDSLSEMLTTVRDVSKQFAPIVSATRNISKCRIFL